MPESETPTAAVEPRATGSRLRLGVLLTCQFMIVIDVSVVTTALPSIRDTLGFSSTGLTWVQNAYTLTFGGLLLLGARTGDLLGRRRVLRAGVGLFTIASLAGSVAQSPAMLLAARAGQGVGAALTAPSVLALLSVSFSRPAERVRAIALYSAVAGAGSSVGLVLGGVLTTWPSWRWGLLLNVPAGAAVIALSPRCLPETRPRIGRFDLAGAATSTLGVGALVLALVEAAHGWTQPTTITSLAASLAFLTAFALIESRAPQPITPLGLFASRRRTSAYLGRLLLVGGVFPLFFFLTQYLQGALGLSPIAAGLAYLPMTITMFTVARRTPWLAARVGETRVLASALVTAILGMLWLGRMGSQTTYVPFVLASTMLVGLGAGAAFTILTARGMADVADSEAGAAAGLVNAAHQLGGTIGLGVLITVFAANRTGTPSTASRTLAHAIGAALNGAAVLLVLAFIVTLYGSPSAGPKMPPAGRRRLPRR